MQFTSFEQTDNYARLKLITFIELCSVTHSKVLQNYAPREKSYATKERRASLIEKIACAAREDFGHKGFGFVD